MLFTTKPLKAKGTSQEKIIFFRTHHYVTFLDCLLYREIKNNQDQIDMQRDLDALMDWGSTWGMKFNAKKSVTLCGSRVLANLCSISTV